MVYGDNSRGLDCSSKRSFVICGGDDDSAERCTNSAITSRDDCAQKVWENQHVCSSIFVATSISRISEIGGLSTCTCLVKDQSYAEISDPNSDILQLSGMTFSQFFLEMFPYV